MGIREIIDKLRESSIFNKIFNEIFIKKDITGMNLAEINKLLPLEVQQELPNVIRTYKIDTPLRLSHFLAQCAHESGNWKFKVENLNYSAQALQSVFRKYFPNEATASQYARKPERIANFVYANRMENGSPESGDGWRFRGRGYIQLTGRANYRLFNQTVNEDILSTPDLVADKYPLLSAAWFWNTNNLNTLADSGSTREDITKVTRRVNGGTNGLDDRIFKFNQYFNTL
jgi:putative chitinase